MGGVTLSAMTEAAHHATTEDVPRGYSERLSLLVHLLGLELLGGAAQGLADLGLTERQYVALGVLASDEPGSQHELGKLMGLAPQLVVSLTDSLEDRGLVSRRTNPDDRRRTLVELTRRGRRLLGRADELTEQIENSLLATLGDDERRRLHDALRMAFGAAYADGARKAQRR